ncbi:hypothetical protein [Amycolatopsis sp. NPDC003731]
MPDKGDRWYILQGSDTVLYWRSDSSVAPELDKDCRRVQIVTAATLRRASETWRAVPIKR